jgi:hypothetical protein
VDPYARLDVYGHAIWVAEPFSTAAHYATRGSELTEHELRAAFSGDSVGSAGAQAQTTFQPPTGTSILISR